MQYQRVPSTPFVPLFLPDETNMRMIDMIRSLQCPPQRSLIIFLVHQPIQFQLFDPQQYPIVYQTLLIPKSHLPDGPAFYEFKRMVFTHLKMYPNSFIGISTKRRNDLCCYFIARWLIEESMLSIKDALLTIQSLIPSGITKKKYLDSLTELYNDFRFSDSMYGDDEQNGGLLPVSVSEESITTRNRSIIINNNADPILSSIGMSVQPRDTQQILSEVRVLLNLNDNDYLVQPYFRFHSGIVKLMNDDPSSLYLFMPEPIGRRCLLYIRGPDRFLVGDNGFLRQVELYLPEHEKRPQCITSGILEGTLALESEDSLKTKFYITDLYLFDSDDMRNKPFDSRIGTIYQKIIRFRKEQLDQHLNSDYFDRDDMSIDIRRYLRLKYIDNVFENPISFLSSPIDGLVFANKAPPTTRSQISFMWTSKSRDDIPVRLRIERNEDGEKPTEKFVGMMYSKEQEQEIPVVIFHQQLDHLRKLEGKLVDIDIIDAPRGLLAVKGISEHQNPYHHDKFCTLLAKENGNIFTKEDLQQAIHQIILLPRYLEEDRAKHKRSQ